MQSVQQDCFGIPRRQGPPRSEISIDTSNGYGSTNTKVVRFTNVRKSSGIAISYLDSAANGASFKIMEEGVYAVTFCMSGSGVAMTIGIVINGTALTTNVGVPITWAQGLRAISASGGSGQLALVQWTGFCLPGDMIYPQATGGTLASGNGESMTVTKVSG